ncbi:hypothetical protein [Streptosporangium sp. NPDC023615]|uniref:hypothetical protein n=1 Tax=Streptosporangium sp. NPDC023615 TaxID=3154794 RepID=UPI00341F122B
MTTSWRRSAALLGLVLTLPLAHAAPASAGHASDELMIRLESLYASDISESGGHDELYLLRKGNGLVWPGEYPGISVAANDCIVFGADSSMCPDGSNVRPAGDQNVNWANLRAAGGEQVTLELWDEDLIGDDKLGSSTITAAEGDSGTVLWRKSGDWRYHFNYRVTTNPWP